MRVLSWIGPACAGACGLAGCLDGPLPHPYPELTCRGKLDQIERELREYYASHPGALAKSAGGAGDSAAARIAADTGTVQNPYSTISAVQISSAYSYRAQTRICLYPFGPTLRVLEQEFRVPPPDSARKPGSKYVSFLAWDNLDGDGMEVPSGTYLWRIHFEYDGAAPEDKTVLTGYLDSGCREALAEPG